MLKDKYVQHLRSVCCTHIIISSGSLFVLLVSQQYDTPKTTVLLMESFLVTDLVLTYFAFVNTANLDSNQLHLYVLITLVLTVVVITVLGPSG